MFHMKFYKIYRKSLLIFVILFSAFFYVVFSDETNTRYTEFRFSGGSDHVSLNLSWGETGSVSVFLENKSTVPLVWLLSFVDGDVVQYGNTWVRVCKSENEKDVFGQYLTTDSNVISLQPQQSITKNLGLNFPSWYSGLYRWCVVYYPDISEGNGSLNTVPRKAIFLDVNVFSSKNLFKLKVYPSDRSSYSNKWSSWTLFFYKANNTWQVVFSWEVKTETNWVWEFFATIEGWEYFVVYKWLSHLASYISWFVIDWEDNIELDFTTWSNLFKTKEYARVEDDWFRYQIAWDLKNIQWLYDWKVNVNDIATLVSDVCWYNSSVDQYHQCNLNGDNMINIADVSVIITNIWQEWPFLQWHEMFGWF